VLLTWISFFPYSRKQSARLFWKFPGTNGSSLPHSPEKGVTSRGIPKFSEISDREYFRFTWFSSLNFRDFQLSGSHFRNSTIFGKHSQKNPCPFHIPILCLIVSSGTLHSTKKYSICLFPDIYSEEWNSIFWNSTEDKSLALQGIPKF